jgi:hypothetical protein
MGAAPFGKGSMTEHVVADSEQVAVLGPLDPAVSTVKLTADLEAVLRPFLDQLAAPDLIVMVGCHGLSAKNGDGGERARWRAGANEALFVRPAAFDDRSLTIVERVPIPAANGLGGAGHALNRLARRADELANSPSGVHLIALPGDILENMMVPPDEAFGFRGVVTMPSRDFGRSGWKLQRALFDHGLVGIGAMHIAGGEAHCFLASDTVSKPRGLGAGSRGTVAMTNLGNHGRFANQLFQYAFLKLYALRHGATATVPEWRGKYLYGFDDPAPAGLALPQLSFPGHVNVEAELWDVEEPPLGVNMRGYFQETPLCWRKHRQFLRRLFQLPFPLEGAVDAWLADVTRSGQRTLVAIHLRRGDYRKSPADNMRLRLIPEEWYLAWLRTIWPELRDPLLFVATDEPNVIRPLFKEFETILATFGGTAQLLPDFLRDFEILRRADYLAICNSSFSRMAAILAQPAQRCFLPTFQKKCFVPYEPWLDRDFWARFAVK